MLFDREVSENKAVHFVSFISGKAKVKSSYIMNLASTAE